MTSAPPQWITELDDAALRDLFALALDTIVAGQEADAAPEVGLVAERLGEGRSDLAGEEAGAQENHPPGGLAAGEGATKRWPDVDGDLPGEALEPPGRLPGAQEPPGLGRQRDRPVHFGAADRHR